jgi:1-pyrroline-5-carboxylate dehydrogenase
LAEAFRIPGDHTG